MQLQLRLGPGQGEGVEGSQVPQLWDGWGECDDEGGHGSEAVLVELGDAWVRWPWQHGGGEEAGRKRLRWYGNEMGGIENENGTGLHDWSSCLFEHFGAPEDDSVKYK